MEVSEVGRPHEAYSDIHSGFGYNLGDLLNMPSFIKPYQSVWPPGGSKELREVAIAIRDSHPNSIVGRYFHNTSALGGRLPDAVHLRSVVYSYGQSISVSLDKYLATTIDNPSTLLVHIRSCDKNLLHKTFLNYARHLSFRFEHFVLMGQCHNDTRFSSVNTALKNLKMSFDLMARSISHETTVSLFPRGTADDHLFAMSRATNLLVHRGGFSALGALTCRGNVFFSRDMSAFTENHEFMNLVLHPNFSK